MLKTLEAPELIFGLCSPLGTDNTKVTRMLSAALRKYSYRYASFKVTNLMKDLDIKGLKLKTKPIEERYDSHIKYANKLRSLSGAPEILAMLCSAKLRSYRRTEFNIEADYKSYMAYIFDQFKRVEEINALRQIYGRLFILISIYSEKENRIKQLSEKIATDHTRPKSTISDITKARELIDRDEEEEDDPDGQRLRDTFALGDLFINIDNPKEAQKHIERFLDGLFGSNSVSPTKVEYGMYLAKTASLQSMDLSRQVGSAILSERGEIVTMGCNEVPKAFGGTYWTEDPIDARDFFLGKDTNEQLKRFLVADLIRRLEKEKIISLETPIESIVEKAIDKISLKGSALRESLLMDLTEFGRIVHAEMAAICDAARLGKSINKHILYCTTFPCHICAKHIITAGIARVIYIEPYPKSYTEQLYSDSITLSMSGDSKDKVIFQPFIGISPSRYREIFERGRRKDNEGLSMEWIDNRPHPIIKYTVATYLDNETVSAAKFRLDVENLISLGHITLKKNVEIMSENAQN